MFAPADTLVPYCLYSSANAQGALSERQVYALESGSIDTGRVVALPTQGVTSVSRLELGITQGISNVQKSVKAFR